MAKITKKEVIKTVPQEPVVDVSTQEPVVSDDVKETVVQEIPVQKAVTKEKRVFNDRDGILCRSLTPGVLIMHGVKTNIDYVWDREGLETEVEYQDLVAAVRTRSIYIYGPHIIILDEDFLEDFPAVKKIYDSMYSVDDLGEILALPVIRMRKEISKLPDGAKKSILSLAASQMKDGKLDSIQKIRAINEIFGCDLMLMSDIQG